MGREMIEQINDETWARFKKRAEELRQSSKSIRVISDDEKEKIFKQRAKKLSLVKEKSESEKDLIKIISFYVAGGLYGIEVKYLLEVYEINSITKIPCTPPVLSGLINYRGIVLTIINLKLLFNLKNKKKSEQAGLQDKRNKGKEKPSQKIIILDCLDIKAGIAIDRFDSLLEIPLHNIKPVSSFFKDKNKNIKSEVRVHDKPLLIIDPEELLEDKRLIAKEDI